LPVGEAKDRVAREADQVDVGVNGNELEVVGCPHSDADRHPERQPQGADCHIDDVDSFIFALLRVSLTPLRVPASDRAWKNQRRLRIAPQEDGTDL
jgi:hypothetical protein